MPLEEFILYLYAIDPDKFPENVGNFLMPYQAFVQQARKDDVIASKALLNYFYYLNDKKHHIPEDLQSYINDYLLKITKPDRKKKGRHSVLLRNIKIAIKVHKKFKLNTDNNIRTPTPIYRQVAKEINECTTLMRQWGIFDEDKVGTIYRKFKGAYDYIDELNQPLEKISKERNRLNPKRN